MTDKEVAEKVAEKLGWKKIIIGLSNNPNFQTKHNTKFITCDGGVLYGDQLPDSIFSWPTFGLMVEDAERQGWELAINGYGMCFTTEAETVETKYFSTTEHGYIKACALAYLEIPDG